MNSTLSWNSILAFLCLFSPGLDPAGPLFRENDINFRLDPGDAKYVDVMHTSTAGIGADQTVGHTEFFPNGGSDQPGCDSLLSKWTVFLTVTRGNETLTLSRRLGD